MAVTGGCLCKSVRISIEAEPLAARICWCRQCQYLGGGTATANICFPTEHVSVAGEVRWHESFAESGNLMRRGFCPNCGTPLFSRAETRPHLTFIRIGAMDDPELLAPDAIIWTDAAPTWACLNRDIPNYPAQIPPVT